MKVIKFAPGLIPVLKHQEHDQSSHGSWADGSQGATSNLSDDEIRDVIYNSKTVNEMFQKVAKRLGKSMKPSVDNLSEDEITHYRGVPDVSRDAQRLLDGKIKFTEFQTWGQGIYLAEDKGIASNYGTLIGMKLDSSAKIVQGETTWVSAFDVSYDNPSARTRNTTTSSFIDLGRIETQIRAGKMDNLSISDMRNIYWAAKGFDGFTTYGETVLFNGSKLTINKADIGTAVQKHQEHDQKTHGNWATGGEIANWNPTDAIPDSPKNAGGMTAKSWEAWEHGPDGQNFIALFRKYACQELGLEVPKTPFDQGGYLNYMMDRGWGKPSRDEAKGMLNAIANGRPQPALYRGMYDSDDAQDQASLDALLSTKAGDTFDMPLVSTTRSLGVATWYAADMVGAGKRSIIMKIQEGAKGVALKKENSTYPQDHEVITSGKFEVVSINKVSTPYWSRSVFEPRFRAGDAEYADHYEIATYDKTRFTPEQAKTAWEAVSSGNYKSLETPTFKLTPDRSGGGLSSWTKQEGKEFTVIEVKMVEPHTVQKAQDFGNQFFYLFNNMPFIHDESEDVLKHLQGLHDQRTHGSWAGGGGVGVDITEALDEVFFNNKLKIEESKIFPGNLRIVIQSEIERSGLNKETVDLIDKMSEAQIASGQAYGDNALKIIAERQGFTGKPETVESVEDLEEIQKTDGGILVYRGIADYSQEVMEISARHSRAENDGGQDSKPVQQILREGREIAQASVSYTAEQALTDFREGEYFGGWGVFGNGTYTTTDKTDAVSYAMKQDTDNGMLGNGRTMAMLIPSTAKAPSESVVKTVVKNMVYGGIGNHRNNVGRMLASMGYQYYDAGYVQSDKSGNYVVLDRSMLKVAKKPAVVGWMGN